MKKTFQNSLKFGFTAASIALLSACGGGGGGEVIVVTDQPHGFFSVDNINVNGGVVCVEDIFIEAGSAQGAQVAVDIANFYGLGNPFANPTFLTYSAPTYCGGPTSNFVPTPFVIIQASYYYNVIVPSVR
jgi:hypothetical protein